MTTCGIEPAREQVLLSQIIFDEGLYPRVEGHDPATVQTYVRDMEQIEAAKINRLMRIETGDDHLRLERDEP